MNMYRGYDVYGCASNPDRKKRFLDDVWMSFGYHRGLEFQNINLFAGKMSGDFPIEMLDAAFKQGLTDASRDLHYMFEDRVIGLIEPLCNVQDYYLSSFDKAVEILDDLKENHVDNIKLLLDVYHLHKITGDVKENLEKYYPYSGHIQISQNPGRVEPFHPSCRIDYEYVLNFLEDKGHSDYIGLKYTPSGRTQESFGWMSPYI